MLELPNVTLVSIDCYNPKGALASMLHSMSQVKFSSAVLATDLSRHPGIAEEAMDRDVRVWHTNQSDRKVVIPDGRLNVPDYEWDVLTITPSLFHTEFCLFQEWDARILNPDAWTDEFLKYDYIGAPWAIPETNPARPECREDNCVGNGGFSIRSKKFCESVRALTESIDDIEAFKDKLSSDVWMCREVDKDLKESGIRFAPESLAARFSCEDRKYDGQFGCHGKYTKQLNDWNWD